MNKMLLVEFDLLEDAEHWLVDMPTSGVIEINPLKYIALAELVDIDNDREDCNSRVSVWPIELTYTFSL